MKKITGAFLLLFASVFHVFTSEALLPPQYTDNDSYNVKGKVGRVVVKTYQAIDKFDHVELGDLVENTVIVDFGDSNQWKGLTELNEKGDISFYFLSQYNEAKQLISQKRYSDKDMMESYSTFTYGKNGQLLTETAYNAKGEVAYRENGLYDKAGNKTSVIRYDSKGEKVQTKNYTYTPQAWVQSESISGKDDQMLYQILRTYTSDGRIEAEENRNKNGMLTSKIVYAYNAQGHIHKVRQTAPGKAVRTIRLVYEYDNHENWIKRTLYMSDYIPSLVMMRLIEYK